MREGNYCASLVPIPSLSFFSSLAFFSLSGLTVSRTKHSPLTQVNTPTDGQLHMRGAGMGTELGLAWLPGCEQAADTGFPAQRDSELPWLGQRCLCAVLPLVPITWLSWPRRFQPSPHGLAVGYLLQESLPEHCEPMGAAPPAKPLPTQWLSLWVTHTAGQRQRLTRPCGRPWSEPGPE